MNASAVCLTKTLPIRKSKCFAPKKLFGSKRNFVLPKAAAVSANESSTVDYNSLTSVFPAEACDIIGGEACSTRMYPETKLKTSQSDAMEKVASEEVEREYLEYNQNKTVFPGEACDDLGGEFCEAEYQMGVYREKALA